MISGARHPGASFAARLRARASRCAMGTVVAVLFTLFSVPRARAQYILDKPPEEARGLEITTRLGDSIPLNLTFTRSNGKPVKLEELFHHNRPVIMAMVYFRCPLLCPKVQEDIIKSLNGLDFTVGKEFDLVIVSFDPRDGPVESERARTDALRMYGHNTTESVLAGWTYLTGTPENSRALGDGLGFPFRFLPKSGEFSHGTAIYILTPEGVISRCIPRLDYDVRDLRFSLIDASGGKIGTLSDRFTLFCYHPAANGKYIISPMRVMQVGAAISAVLVFSVLGFLFAGEAIKRRQRRLASLIGAQTEPESFHVTGPGADSPKAPHPFHKMAGHTS